MRSLLLLLLALLTSCATTAKMPNAVYALGRTPVDVAAYNKIMSDATKSDPCTADHCGKVARLVSGYVPEYPPQLLSSGITGHAVIVFTITEQGSVTNMSVESATRTEFADSAINALKDWKFIPATLNGKAISTRARQLIPFDPR